MVKARLLLCVWLLALLPVFASAEEVDLELVLAMDGSGSVSKAEFLLQLEGTARAFEEPSIQSAIQSGPLGKIAVAVMVWSDAFFPKFKTEWISLSSAQSARAFAQRLRNLNDEKEEAIGIGGGGTGIGDAVREAIEMIKTNTFIGLRRVVDVSGDGEETAAKVSDAIRVAGAKKLAIASNVTVNGLPILTKDFPNLDVYYRHQVIAGAGSFIVIANNFSDFERAIREKLLQEISHTFVQRNDRETKSVFARVDDKE